MARSKPSKSLKNKPESQAESSSIDRFTRLLTRFQRFAWDFGGIFFLAFGLMTLLALLAPQVTGGLLAWWGDLLNIWFGWGSFWVVFGLAAVGVWMIRQRMGKDGQKIAWSRVLTLELAAFASLALMAVLGNVSMDRAEAGLDGGRIGWALAELLRRVLEPVGLAGIFWLGSLLVILFAGSLLIGLGLYKPIVRWTREAALSESQTDSGVPGTAPAVIEAPLAGAHAPPEPLVAPKKKRPSLPAQFRKSFRVQPDELEESAPPPPRDERLPGLDLLVNERFNRPDERNINMTAGMIEKTLAEFGIPAKVVGFRVGPTVTQFAVEPGYVEKDKPGVNGDQERQKIRVSQISALGRDLALALAAERLRIQAPVPGRPYVGIEVPNSRSVVVRLRPILESETFYKIGSPLTIALGRDVSGHPVVADLGGMPHLLIAGTTGSGKSVCIAALTTCLVMNNTPEDLRIVMIDPKMVELVRFNGLPHLYGIVETDLERILAVLRWTVVEMDRRYKVLESSRSRNIDTYNRKAHRRKGLEPMPRIVVMIDELADLMMSAPDETEHNLVRLAQMARATGIHLVVATQRPGTDVVTGLIKANFPARISFSVASSVDSRVILDTGGAESLLGRGDMLFLPPEASGPIRLQGVMVSDQEVEKVITYWQNAIQPEEEAEAPPWDELIEEEQLLAERDVMVDRAVEIVRKTQRASASLLQRRLHIGYPRAARLIDQLEEMGVVGPAVSGGRDREVLVSSDDDGLGDQ